MIPGRDLLEPALAHAGDHTWADVEARLEANTAQLWLHPNPERPEAAIVTEIWGGCLHVWLGGGSLKGLLRLRPRLEEWGRAVGLKRITGAGRDGWKRARQRHDYRWTGTELEKTL